WRGCLRAPAQDRARAVPSRPTYHRRPSTPPCASRSISCPADHRRRPRRPSSSCSHRHRRPEPHSPSYRRGGAGGGGVGRAGEWREWGGASPPPQARTNAHGSVAANRMRVKVAQESLSDRLSTRSLEERLPLFELPAAAEQDLRGHGPSGSEGPTSETHVRF